MILAVLAPTERAIHAPCERCGATRVAALAGRAEWISAALSMECEACGDVGEVVVVIDDRTGGL